MWAYLRTLVSNDYHYHFWIPYCDVAARSHALAVRVFTRMLPNGDSQLRGRACLRCGSAGKRFWRALFVAFLFSHYGYTSVFIYIAACWLLVALTIGIFGPLTKGRTLV